MEDDLIARGSLIGAPGRLAAVAGLLLVLGACDRSKSNAGSTLEGAAALGENAEAALPAYVEREVAAGGALRGTVELEGTYPTDTLVRSSSDEAVCGAEFYDVGAERTGNRLGGTVVWLDGIRSGKPLPLERRYEATHTRCRLTPRVQAALVGGTLNIRSVDPIWHRTRILGMTRRDTLSVVSQSDAGQVVPVEGALREPGQLELRCDLHPWTRAWIAVFDHPYFAVTERDGAFTLDGIPPGRYRLVAWHERFGIVEDSVDVTAGQTGRVKVVMQVE